MHTTIYSISESPLDPNLIWVGTDDGNVQITRDGGAHWTNVIKRIKGVPAGSWVSWVEASRFDAGVAYVAFDRHTEGDLTPHVFRTDDYGQSWTRIASEDKGIRGYAHVIREDSADRNLLFLGTEFGLWISIDGGQQWARVQGRQLPGSRGARPRRCRQREGMIWCWARMAAASGSSTTSPRCAVSIPAC
jgi:photosystem II stability/assembly factor-like uncharacterized protein